MALEQNPLGGDVYVFRGRRGDLVKLLWHDGDGLCLLQKKVGSRTLPMAAGR